MEPFRYRIVTEWSDEDDAFIARVPALPGCAAHGETADEAIREVCVAAEGVLEVMRDDKRSIPAPDTNVDYSGNIRLRLPPTLHRRLTELATAEETSLNNLMVAALAAFVERPFEMAQSRADAWGDLADKVREMAQQAREVTRSVESAVATAKAVRMKATRLVAPTPKNVDRPSSERIVVKSTTKPTPERARR